MKTLAQIELVLTVLMVLALSSSLGVPAIVIWEVFTVIFIATTLFYFGANFLGIWSPKETSAMGKRRDRSWIFFALGVLWCSIVGNLLYSWTESDMIGLSTLAGLFFWLVPYILTCMLFVNATIAEPFICLPAIWKTLRPGQRLGIIAFLLWAAGFLALCLTFILALDGQIVQVQYPE